MNKCHISLLVSRKVFYGCSCWSVYVITSRVSSCDSLSHGKWKFSQTFHAAHYKVLNQKVTNNGTTLTQVSYRLKIQYSSFVFLLYKGKVVLVLN